MTSVTKSTKSDYTAADTKHSEEQKLSTWECLINETDVDVLLYGGRIVDIK